LVVVKLGQDSTSFHVDIAMRFFYGLLLSLPSLFCAVRGQYTSTYPVPIPLFHKSPYLNARINADANVTSTPARRSPKFFSGPVRT